MSVRPPSGMQPTPPRQPDEGNLQQLKKEFLNHLDQATTELRLVTNSPHLLDSASALETLANALKDLNAPSKQAAELGEH